MSITKQNLKNAAITAQVIAFAVSFSIANPIDAGPLPTASITVVPAIKYELVDARNKLIGVFQPDMGNVGILIRGQFYFPMVSKEEGFIGRGIMPLFATTDCTGAPYVVADQFRNTFLNAPYAMIGSVLYTGQLSDTRTGIVLNSRYDLSGKVCIAYREDNFSVADSTEVEVIPLSQLIDLNAFFKPPFHMRVTGSNYQQYHVIP